MKNAQVIQKTENMQLSLFKNLRQNNKTKIVAVLHRVLFYAMANETQICYFLIIYTRSGVINQMTFKTD